MSATVSERPTLPWACSQRPLWINHHLGRRMSNAPKAELGAPIPFTGRLIPFHIDRLSPGILQWPALRPPQPRLGQVEVALDMAVYFIVDDALVAQLQNSFPFD